MFNEKAYKDESSLFSEYLGEKEDLKRRIKEAIDVANKGYGFRIGTNSFINSIIGPSASQLAPGEFKFCKEEIMRTIREINPRRGAEEKKGNNAGLKLKKDDRRGAFMERSLPPGDR